jgi:hypothetical protein
MKPGMMSRSSQSPLNELPLGKPLHKYIHRTIGGLISTLDFHCRPIAPRKAIRARTGFIRPGEGLQAQGGTFHDSGCGFYEVCGKPKNEIGAKKEKKISELI